MAQRNYPCDNYIDVYFGKQPDAFFNSTGESVFKRQLYMCTLASALGVKSDIESLRAGNHFGVIVWQFNEIWPTGGWGSVEYGTPLPGQVIGGRWKPLQYLYRRSLFSDVMATCGKGGSCFVRNDDYREFDGVCTVSALILSTGESHVLKSVEMTGENVLPSGPGSIRYFDVDMTGLDSATHMLTAHCMYASSAGPGVHRPTISAAGAVGVTGTVSFNEILLAPPMGLKLRPAKVTFDVASSASTGGSVKIVLHADHTALFVTLTTLAHGRFSDNAFAMRPGTVSVQFFPFGDLDLPTLTSSLRVEHLQQIMTDEFDQKQELIDSVLAFI
jgi:hypothetical protein